MEPFTLARDDHGFPVGMRDIKSLASVRVLGTIPSDRGIAIVGSRVCSHEAEEFAFKLASQLVRAGLAVWSGGATGIDAAAHGGAMAGGGRTVAVLGSGVLEASPASNQRLFDDILSSGGALVSRREDHATSQLGSFHARNAVIAAATEATLVIECRPGSGALNTANHATRFGRPLGFVPHAPWSPWGKGGLAWLSRGAKVVTDLPDALSLLPLPPDPSAVDGPLFAKTVLSGPALTELEQKLCDALTTPRHIDQLCDQLERSPKDLVPVLVTLSIRGLVIEDTPGTFRKI